MKLKLELLIVASLFVYASTETWTCTDSDWYKYKEKFNKSYNSAEMELSHYNTFCDNLILINEHNKLYDANESTYELEVNQFTDLNGEQRSQNRRRAHGNRPIKRPSRVENEEDY